MDRNTFTGLFLILVILVGSTFLLKPSEEEVKKEKAVQDSIAYVKRHGEPAKKVEKAAVVAVPPTDSSKINTSIDKEEITVLENDKVKLSVSNLGGKIVSVALKGETDYAGKTVVLFNNQNNYGLEFTSGNQNINTNNLFFAKQESSPNKLTMRLQNADGSFIDYIYTLQPNSNKVGFDIAVNGFQNNIKSSTRNLVFNWEAALQKQEKDIKNERLYSTTYYKYKDGDVDYLSTAKSDDKTFEEGSLEWVSFKQHFFSAALISEAGFNKGEVEVKTLETDEAVKIYQAKLNLPYKNQAANNYSMQFYFGSNKFSQLKAQGHDLEKQVKMGWGPLKWINRYLVLPIFNFFEGFNLSYGLIILLLTIILKSVLFPFTYKSYLSMAKMRVLKPEMEEIKQRVGEGNQALVQQEYLKLYKQAGVNPLGGCLPLVFQMPFILAFFYFFPNLFELRHESFLWMKDLSTYDEFIKFPTIPFIGNHISLMCLLMTCSTLVYTYFNNQVSGATGQMKYIGYISPLIFFGVLNSYPAGLNYYYFCANILTFSQQYFIRRFVNDDKIHAQIQQNKQKPESAKKKGGFQKKLEDMMRQQQQIKQQEKKK